MSAPGTEKEEASSPILIIGASVRAAAFSALRAGLTPWCIDLFADADLRARCPTMQLPGAYPDDFLPWIAGELPGPWMYTGALEGYPWLIERMERRRPLWGNGQRAVLSCRHPGYLRTAFVRSGSPAPEVHLGMGRLRDVSKRWLLKPLRGAGGAGIRFLENGEKVDLFFLSQMYAQEYVEGEPVSLLYVGEGSKARFLGMSHQLIGLDWARSEGFRYCGSIGPVELPSPFRQQLEKLGTDLVQMLEVAGLFGIDGVIRDGAFWPVELNPRYTASAEVHEYATGMQTLAWHRRAFDKLAPEPPAAKPPQGVVGKVILFARQDLTFPGEGPWRQTLEAPRPVEEMPLFADIPPPGENLRKGKPIFTLLARESTVASCLRLLRERVNEAEAWLYRAE